MNWIPPYPSLHKHVPSVTYVSVLSQACTISYLRIRPCTSMFHPLPLFPPLHNHVPSLTSVSILAPLYPSLHKHVQSLTSISVLAQAWSIYYLKIRPCAIHKHVPSFTTISILAQACSISYLRIRPALHKHVPSLTSLSVLAQACSISYLRSRPCTSMFHLVYCKPPLQNPGGHSYNLYSEIYVRKSQEQKTWKWHFEV